MEKVLRGTSDASKDILKVYIAQKGSSDWKKNGSLKTCLPNMIRQKYWHHRSHLYYFVSYFMLSKSKTFASDALSHKKHLPVNKAIQKEWL